MVKKRNKRVSAKKKKKTFPTFSSAIISLSLLTLLLLFGLEFYGYLLKLPYFSIREITVKSGDRVGSSEIIERSGVHFGDNLLSLNLRDISLKLKKNPWIEEVKVRKVFPAELEIGVKERVPVALLRSRGFYFIDESGVIFNKMTGRDMVDLPIITGIGIDDLINDDPHASESVFNALSLLEAMKSNSFIGPDDLSEIRVSKNNGLTLYTLKGAVRIDMGNREFEKRLARLEKIAVNLKGKFWNLDYIDLTYDKKAVAKYRKA